MEIPDRGVLAPDVANEMTETRSALDRPIRVVMFGSGPALTHDARQFLARLEEHPEIEFLAAVCQAESQTFGAVARDLWRRRGALAGPLLVAWVANNAGRFLFRPQAEVALRRKLAQMADRIHFVADIHDPQVLNQVKALAADLGLIYGSPILRPELFEIPAFGTLGIHHGKVPQYRGNKTTFWAMYNGEETAGRHNSESQCRIGHRPDCQGRGSHHRPALAASSLARTGGNGS
jgi:hypothetical protein